QRARFRQLPTGTSALQDQRLRIGTDDLDALYRLHVNSSQTLVGRPAAAAVDPAAEQRRAGQQQDVQQQPSLHYPRRLRHQREAATPRKPTGSTSSKPPAIMMVCQRLSTMV